MQTTHQKTALKEKVKELIARARNISLYHGTSSMARETIEKYGLDPNVRAYDAEALRKLHQDLGEAGPCADWDYEFDAPICLTTKKDTAKTYAKQSPEIWLKVLNNYKALVQSKYIENLPEDKRKDLGERVKRFSDLFASASPIVVVVDSNASSLADCNHFLKEGQKYLDTLDKIQNPEWLRLFRDNIYSAEQNNLGWDAIINPNGIIPREYIKDIYQVPLIEK